MKKNGSLRAKGKRKKEIKGKGKRGKRGNPLISRNFLLISFCFYCEEKKIRVYEGRKFRESAVKIQISSDSRMIRVELNLDYVTGW